MWCKHFISIKCSKCQYNFKNHIERMPETIIYETESMINSLQLGLFNRSTLTPHTDCRLCATHLRMNINSNNTNYYTRSGTCKSSGLIYAIKCGTCNKIYKGQTKNRLRVRLLQHISDIRRGNTVSSVAIHFKGVCGRDNWTGLRKRLVQRLSKRKIMDRDFRFRESTQMYE